MDVWFPHNNPIRPCSVFDKSCLYTAATNIKITEIIPFTEKTNVENRTFLVSMNVMSLDTNIQQNEGILSVTKHIYRLILKENVFHFSGKHYLQNHGTAMSTKTAVMISLPIFS